MSDVFLGIVWIARTRTTGSGPLCVSPAFQIYPCFVRVSPSASSLHLLSPLGTHPRLLCQRPSPLREIVTAATRRAERRKPKSHSVSASSCWRRDSPMYQYYVQTQFTTRELANSKEKRGIDMLGEGGSRECMFLCCLGSMAVIYGKCGLGVGCARRKACHSSGPNVVPESRIVQSED